MADQRIRRKGPPPKQTVNKNGVEWFRVGKGFSERLYVSRNNDPNVIHRHRSSAEGITFEDELEHLERGAKRVLERAGLPTDTEVVYTIPEGAPFPPPMSGSEAEELLSRPGVTDIVSHFKFISSLGFREREDLEWYAARILWETRLARRLLREGTRNDGSLAPDTIDRVLKLAMQMGETALEAKARGYFKKAGARTKGKEKKLRPVAEWLRETIKRYPDKPYTFFWNSLPDHDEGETPKRTDDAELIREGGVLVVYYDSGRTPSIGLPAFRRYVADVKKELKL